MTIFDSTRREFLIEGAAAAALSTVRLPRLMAQEHPALPQSRRAAPKVITGKVHPLLVSNTARPLRYTPEPDSFLIRNGKQYFNRPIYGPNNAFRVDAGDLPEFSLYLPGHGGNLRLGLASPAESKWLSQTAEVVARYRPGRMLYEIRDPLLGDGALHLELLTKGEGSGILVRAEARGVPASVMLVCAFGGVSGRKGQRNGDIGCEVEPVSEFFQVRPEECAHNHYEINGATARLRSPAADLFLNFPAGSTLRTADGRAWYKTPAELRRTTAGSLPVLTGALPLDRSEPFFITLDRLASPDAQPPAFNAATAFAARSRQVAAIASSVRFDTPDPYVNLSAPALAIAADALWDDRLGCLMHGAVAWRVPLVGWRGPYALDDFGDHARMRQNLRHWIARQNTSPVDTESPATGPADPGTHLTRHEHLLHSSGDLSNNHYDMNLVFFDGFLRHLRWTGDLEFARQVWPAFVLHLAWERRLFRRTFTAADGRQLPLYEAYACIWASDNLQYNGGGAAHSSAYNYYSHRAAAQLARMLGEDPTPFEDEAQLILEAMNQLLWQQQQGAFAEAKDILTRQTVYTAPAVWTVYQSIDSAVPNRRQAWQMATERLHALRPVPIHGPGVPQGGWYLLSCSNWLPYEWSLNLLVLAENTATALALWQAGLADEAFCLLKGNLLDSMYQGLCPGNFHMSSQLDDHRQEAQRDFGDPIGITSRALIEGLYGIQPDVLHGVLTVRPGFPSEWDHASLDHPDLSLQWQREQTAEGVHEQLKVISRLPRPVALHLVLPARTTTLPTVRAGGSVVPVAFDAEAVGNPAVLIHLPVAAAWDVQLDWRGAVPTAVPEYRTYLLEEAIEWPAGVTLSNIDDPQGCLRHGRAVTAGHHTVFARVHEHDCRWTLPISFAAKGQVQPASIVTRVPQDLHPEPLNLQPWLNENITAIFRRSYVAPRSPYCSLAIPEQGIGGWANFNTLPTIDDAGLRAAGGMLRTPFGVPFRTPAEATAPNCRFISCWEQDQSRMEIPLNGRAHSLYLLMAGSTLPQASHMNHGTITVRYADGGAAELVLRNPETWWPIERDYLLDDYLFRDAAPLPPRVDLRTGEVRVLTDANFIGRGRAVPGGAATILELPLNPERKLHSFAIEATLYGIILGLLGATLVRPQPRPQHV